MKRKVTYLPSTEPRTRTVTRARHESLAKRYSSGSVSGSITSMSGTLVTTATPRRRRGFRLRRMQSGENFVPAPMASPQEGDNASSRTRVPQSMSIGEAGVAAGAQDRTEPIPAIEVHRFRVMSSFKRWVKKWYRRIRPRRPRPSVPITNGKQVVSSHNIADSVDPDAVEPVPLTEDDRRQVLFLIGGTSMLNVNDSARPHPDGRSSSSMAGTYEMEDGDPTPTLQGETNGVEAESVETEIDNQGERNHTVPSPRPSDSRRPELSGQTLEQTPEQTPEQPPEQPESPRPGPSYQPASPSADQYQSPGIQRHHSTPSVTMNALGGMWERERDEDDRPVSPPAGSVSTGPTHTSPSIQGSSRPISLVTRNSMSWPQEGPLPNGVSHHTDSYDELDEEDEGLYGGSLHGRDQLDDDDDLHDSTPDDRPGNGSPGDTEQRQQQQQNGTTEGSSTERAGESVGESTGESTLEPDQPSQ
jgi:hypothetical protein